MGDYFYVGFISAFDTGKRRKKPLLGEGLSTNYLYSVN